MTAPFSPSHEGKDNGGLSQTADPLIGAEVIRVSLEYNGVYLHFSKSTVMIYAPFSAFCENPKNNMVNIWLNSGDVSTLRKLIGAKITRVKLEGIAEFEFDNGTMLQLQDGKFRGEIISEPLKGENGMGWDMF